MSPLELWLLDADVIIDFLSLDVFDKLIGLHEVYAADTVVGQVKRFRRGQRKFRVDFRDVYIKRGLVKELHASSNEVKEVLSRLPRPTRDLIHTGELESLAILVREESLTFCSCDAATIRALPFLDLADRGVSAETLLKMSGLLKPGIRDRHSEAYFRSNLVFGQKEMIYAFKRKKS